MTDHTKQADPTEPTDRSPMIGIWWDYAGQVVALAHPPNTDSHGTDLIDSDLDHWREWPRICRRFGRSPESEYFALPRGRVMHRADGRPALIYHGSITPHDRLLVIAAHFRLDRWESRLDEHYELEPIDWD